MTELLMSAKQDLSFNALIVRQLAVMTQQKRLNVVTGILVILRAGSCARPSRRPLTTGVGRIASIAYFDEHREAPGFAVDVVGDAARREGVPLRWTPLVKTVGEDLQSGTTDLLAAGMGTDERRQKFYVSYPWWYQSLRTREGQALPPKRLGLQQAYAEFARPTRRAGILDCSKVQLRPETAAPRRRRVDPAASARATLLLWEWRRLLNARRWLQPRVLPDRFDLLN